MKAAFRTRAPTTVKRTVRRGRRPNGHYRTREYLTEKEVERLMKAAGRNRYGHRDATMILLAFRHGLRASELCSLRWGRPRACPPPCFQAQERHTLGPRRQVNIIATIGGTPAVLARSAELLFLPLSRFHQR